MQNPYPGQGYAQQGWGGQPPPPQQQQQQQWGQPPPGGQYGAPPPPAGYPQDPYGGAPPPQRGYPPPQGPYNSAPPPGQYPQQQQQGWVAPPPQQGQYGAPPPQHGQYGAPPPHQQGWGQAPPPQPYGAAHPQQGWGQTPPPPQHYNASPGPPYAPPPQQQQQHFGPPTQPSLGYGPVQTANLDMQRDVEALRKAMKGLGTDEKTLIAVLSKKDPIQMNTLRTQYDQRLMRNLIADLESESSGNFKKALVQIARGPLTGDCYTLYNAMKGMGTKEHALDDVLVGRSNADINAIKAEYQRVFRQSLESDLRGDLSAGTEQMYMIITAARRQEDSVPANAQAIEQDVSTLHTAIGNIVTKNSAQVCELLLTRNDAQLRAICHSYQNRFRNSLESVIKSKFNGHMEDALVLLLARANDRATAEAVRLEESMAGLGTKDDYLIQRVVRCHWDQNFMRAVSDAYQRKYKTSLVRRIEGETRGDYERLLVACVK